MDESGVYECVAVAWARDVIIGNVRIFVETISDFDLRYSIDTETAYRSGPYSQIERTENSNAHTDFKTHLSVNSLDTISIINKVYAIWRDLFRTLLVRWTIVEISLHATVGE